MPPSRHLVRARDLADARYRDPITVADMARAARGRTPTAYRTSYPPAARLARIPACVLKVYGRPQLRTFREDSAAAVP